MPAGPLPYNCGSHSSGGPALPYTRPGSPGILCAHLPVPGPDPQSARTSPPHTQETPYQLQGQY